METTETKTTAETEVEKPETETVVKATPEAEEKCFWNTIFEYLLTLLNYRVENILRIESS